MSAHDIRDTKRPDPDQVLVDIADYVMNYDVTKSSEAMETARYCLMDTLGCGLLALSYPNLYQSFELRRSRRIHAQRSESHSTSHMN
ncbi:MAG: hypothetical protein R3E08_05690 [Thiotrichaceae bacterium]